MARAAAKRGESFLYGDSMVSMCLLMINAEWFRERGMYEKELLDAWSNQKITRNWTAQMKQNLAKCDRVKLLAAGDTLPAGEEFTVYRGVSHPEQDIRGVSWTLDLEVAKNSSAGFIDYHKVYRITIQRGEVYAYLNESHRNEHEVLLVLPADFPVEII